MECYKYTCHSRPALQLDHSKSGAELGLQKRQISHSFAFALLRTCFAYHASTRLRFDVLLGAINLASHLEPEAAVGSKANACAFRRKCSVLGLGNVLRKGIHPRLTIYTAVFLICNIESI